MSESAEERAKRICPGAHYADRSEVDLSCVCNEAEREIRAAESAARAEGIRIGQERMRERAVTIPQMPPRMPAVSGGYYSFLSRGEEDGFAQGWKEYREKIRALEVEDGEG